MTIFPASLTEKENLLNDALSAPHNNSFNLSPNSAAFIGKP